MTAANETPTADLLRPAQREVFLSYARLDLKAAARLDDALRAAGRTTWIDRSGIEPTEEWLPAIYAGIDRSDNFVLLITPRSVASPWCAKEVDAAAAANKRLIPVLVEPADPAKLPPQMAARQWIDCAADFEKGVAELLEALDLDIAYVHEHTRLLGRAIDWKHGRGGLLSRGEVEVAERWLESARKEPAPTPLHAELIVASRGAVTRTQRRIVMAATFAVIVALTLALLALLQRNEARRQREEAERQRGEAVLQRNEARRQREEAERQTAAAKRNLADTMAARAVAAVKPREALRGAVAAIDTAVTPATRDALLRVLQRTDKLRVILDPAETAAHVQGLAFDATGNQLAALLYSDPIQVWDLRTGASRRIEGSGSVSPEPFALQGDLVAWETRVWRGSDKEPFFTLPDDIAPRALALASDRIAAAHDDFITLCGLVTKRCTTVKTGQADALAFTGADGQWLAAGSANEIRILDGRTLRRQRSMPLPSRLVAMGGSASGPLLTLVLSDAGVCTIDVTSGSFDCSEREEVPEPNLERVFGATTLADSTLAVSAGGRLLAIADHDSGIGYIDVDTSIAVWDAARKRGQLLPLRRVGKQGTKSGETVSPDGKLRAVSSEAGVTFYAVPGGQQVGKELAVGKRPFAFIPGRNAILATDGTTLEEWNIETAAHSPRKLDAGQQTGWDTDDAEIQVFAVSPDGRKLASNGGGYAEGMTPRLVLWDLERGTPIASRPFTDYAGRITSIAIGKEVIVTADESSLRMFDASTLAPLGETIELDGSNDPSVECTAHVSADGSHIGAVCGDKAFTFTMDIRAWRRSALERCGAAKPTASPESP